MTQGEWRQVRPGLFMFRDSCTVYAVQGPEGTVVVNAGTGRAAAKLDAVARGKVTVLLTHHFRDHSAGAADFAKAGAEVLGPYWDQDYLADPQQQFQERQTWNSYDNRWDRQAPVRPVPADGWLMDYERREIAGLVWEVIPTPGASPGASSYAVEHGGMRLVFPGEVISAPGKTGRLAPLQYDYNDLLGAVNLWHSCRRLIAAGPDLLLPSLGDPMEDPAGALVLLRENLKKLGDIQPGLKEAMSDPEEDDLEEILPRLFRSKRACAETHFVIGKSGKVLALDYGYNDSEYVAPAKQHLSNRRPFLHGLRGLKRRFGAERVDAVLVSHFHDDHVNGIPLLQRLFGTEVWAADNFSDILERPEHYDLPCLWHEPIRVGRVLHPGEKVRWEDVSIEIHHLSGHTRHGALLCLELEGTRIVHTGDQLFFSGTGTLAFSPESRMFTNHVYKNGLDLGCYIPMLDALKRFQPELVLTGHTRPYRTSQEWYGIIEEGAKSFDEAHGALLSLRAEDVHFGAESQAAKLMPYRVRVDAPGRMEFSGWVLNPFPSGQTAVVRLEGPEGWAADPVELSLKPRERKEFRAAITPPASFRCRRQPVALALTVGGRPFGQVTEALVTIGFSRF